ncbi:universal stress protein [Brevibacterium sp. UMB1308A]|uniref:universal stress protein n=1 Tax=Brevibacterium sp. UMB1308A TaxID=3050608 RepID=UPI00254BCCF2|nr:universal stress protein [Brevibacterium sp. UMB1308A]MDK8347471.1 universal stress protein [Brevibacterium sp. UMB1308B]MDK8714164.1 universal stress protein [Brevibacterium sp. UMB1308A]
MTIIVGYVPKPQGRSAVDTAVQLAKDTGDTLFVVNAGVGEAVDDPLVASPQHLQELRDHLGTTGVPHEVHQFLRGNDPVEEILALEETLPDVRMIVIGTPRRSRVGKLLLGSIAQSIISQATAPVLCVKAPRK